MRNFHKDYNNGLEYRTKLTEMTPDRLKIFMDSFYNIVRFDHPVNKLADFYKDRTINCEYGKEKDAIGNEIEFILNKIEVKWGSWDGCCITLDCLGVTIAYKSEHGDREILWKTSWTDLKDLTNVFNMFNICKK